ncbi:hypothetical protein AVDCRST_MAG81-208 [uncultured Synechococcales cyanobacterium]|uniref:DUF3102 domain-containing protein n=1 Tax=uncultured Synechococcales cyanobacterium TaxID=1936017 RepID=A0A6J4UP40_9CYAN|nr:hypothetical protein AVDCRST_MAG81-208 [uncultured Synechococcales cyanobacterium]
MFILLDQSDQVSMPLDESRTFAYASLDSETRSVVQQCTSEIKSLTRRTSIDTFKIGENLFTVKQRLKYGQFGKWLQSEFGWSQKMAYRFVNVYKCFSCVNLTKLDIPPSVLYDLAEPATPEAARQETLYRARQGETITCSKAREIVERYKNPPILPEVLPPEPSTASTQAKHLYPLLTITLAPHAPAQLAPGTEEGYLEERPLVEAKKLATLQERHKVKPELEPHEQPEQIIHRNAEEDAREDTQSTPLIQLLSIDVDDSKLQENAVEVFEVAGHSLCLQFESSPRAVLSLFQTLQERSSVGKAVQQVF